MISNLLLGARSRGIAKASPALAALFFAGAAVSAPRPTNPAATMEKAFVSVADKVGPTVVSVASYHEVIQRIYSPQDEFEELLRYFGFAPRHRAPRDEPQEKRRRVPAGAGSGFIVSKNGYVLTNAHVIKDATDVTVRLLDDREYKAEIIGRDEATDVAVLKIKAKGDLPAAPLGDSDALRVGQWSIAIGNPFALENTVTVGVISAKGRRLDPRSGGRVAQYTSFIQTDASINPGNSGGPLLNLDGEVIGINTMITTPSGGSVGIGFAVPINVAKPILKSILKKGRWVRPQLGVAFRPLEPEVAKKLKLEPGQGMEVSAVFADTAAEKAGLKPGDIILAADGKPLVNSEDLQNIVISHDVGDRVSLDVYRKGKRLSLSIVLQEAQEQDKDRPKTRHGREAPDGDSQETWLGLTVEDVTPQMARRLGASTDEAVIVVSVAEDSPAAGAGLNARDLIIEIEQEPVGNVRNFKALAKKLDRHKSILFLVQRWAGASWTTMYVVVQRKPGEEDK